MGPRRPSRSVAGRADNRPVRERCVPGYSGGGRAGFSPASLGHFMVTALSRRPYAHPEVASRSRKGTPSPYAARGSYQRALPVRCQAEAMHLRRTRHVSARASRAEPPSTLLARDSLPPWMIVRPTMLKMTPPPHAARFRTRFPGGATLNIVGPRLPADVDDRAPNNVENGTAAARGTFPHALPGRSHPQHCWPETPCRRG